MSLLPRAVRGLRPRLQAYQTLVWSLRRWIYNPTLNPPPTAGPALQEQFRESTAPHLRTEQFQKIVDRNDFFGLFDPKKPKSYTKLTPEELWFNASPRSQVLEPPPNHYAGRSVLIRSDGVGPAWNKLQGVLKQNKIRQELRLTERHEKKGVKRRRLRSERWKRKFADEVRKKVKLVNEIRLRDRMSSSGRH